MSFVRARASLPQHGQGTLGQADPVPRAAPRGPRDRELGAHQHISHICPQLHSHGPSVPCSPQPWLHPTPHGWEHPLAPPGPLPSLGTLPLLQEQPHSAAPPQHLHHRPPTLCALAELSPSPETPSGLSLAPSRAHRAQPRLPPAAGLVRPGLQQQRLEPADGDGGEDGAQEEDAEQDPGCHAQQALLCHPVVTAQPHEPEIAAHGAPAPRGPSAPGGRVCPPGLSPGHSLAAGLVVPGVRADAVVLAVVTVAERGAGHVPVHFGHAGEAGRASEEQSAGVQRPRCRCRCSCVTPGAQCVTHPAAVSPLVPSVSPTLPAAPAPHSPRAPWRSTGTVPTARTEPSAFSRSSSSPSPGSCSAANRAS